VALLLRSTEIKPLFFRFVHYEHFSPPISPTTNYVGRDLGHMKLTSASVKSA